MISRSVIFSLFLSSVLPWVAALQTTCYVLDGKANANAGFRCDNTTTGPSACCGPGATCYSNGLCMQDNGQVVDYLRVGCTDKTWQSPACLDQCNICEGYSNTSSWYELMCIRCEQFSCWSKVLRWDCHKYNFIASIVTAIRNLQADSYSCCDDGSTGVGSFACCNTASDIFQISPAATVLAQMPLSQLTTTSTTATSSPTRSAAATTSASSSGGSSHAAAIGAGVGVPLGLIALGGLGYFFWRRRNNQKKSQTYELQNGQEGPYSGGYGGAVGAGADYQQAAEADSGYPPGSKKSYFGGQQYEPAQQTSPAELPNSQAHVVHELDS
ncbi:uncharacterized protein LY89DRAFT_713222 [Mollisia scopiformis]|uniref:Mid2 domain-containing protein n=1 Tax=Mollisia scopiformis TaxID=149040 RepID=A0A194XVK1_MOLSC|nr:uncharacterized protein LY89DRAFT_713222 [Mollisia scopiformis]KUJ24350.1 hypothetical protein LY89DRAFT_713222 [Mollisia scopiformis]